MIYKVHWIVDGVAEIEADSKEDAEKKLQAVSYTHLTLPTIYSV